MHTINHQLEHFGENLGRAMSRMLTLPLAMLAGAADEIAARGAARRSDEDDDILWDDGEPEDPPQVR